MRPVILYATAEGQTRKICTLLQQRLLERGMAADLFDLTNLPADFVLEQYSHPILAASIRYGHHQKALRQFVKAQHGLLNQRASAFVSVNLTARKAEKNRPDTNPYVQKYLRRTPWQPQQVAVFPGSLRYSEYNGFNKRMIQLIMRMTGGSTDLARDIEYTDWAAVERFALQLGDWLEGSASHS